MVNNYLSFKRDTEYKLGIILENLHLIFYILYIVKTAHSHE